MADDGVTDKGFIRQRLPEIRRDIMAAFGARLRAQGITETPTYTPDSVLGILVDTFAERETALWEMASGLWGAMYPNTASGISLDNAVAYTGVTRRKAEAASGTVYFYGQTDTLIPFGTRVRNGRTGAIWRTTEEKLLSESSVTDLTVTFEGKAQAKTEYGITLNGKKYRVTSPDSPVRQTLLEVLAAQIDKQVFTVSVSESRLSITTLSEEDFSYSLTRLVVETAGIRVAVTTDSDDVANGRDINRAEGSLEGIDTVTNKSSTTLGRGEESDTALRQRYVNGVFRTGAATLPSLRPNVFNNVPGVVDCVVFENSTHQTDSVGRLPHSVHYVVYGGADNAIAEEIHSRKAAGIDTHGKTAVKLAKPYGEFTVRFDRPTLRFVWLTIRVQKTHRHDVVSLERLKERVLTVAGDYHIGESVPAVRFLFPLLSMSEIHDAEIHWALTEKETDKPSAWTSGLIPANPAELLLFAASRINIEAENDD
ncbi:MAG: hypothetical protein EKE20_15175 [Candidatus Symbiopectobacterium sp. Dall1.0]|nr:hypothetical protein [Candidatus Symbiopectobacterium sp. Dall1.0]